MKKLRIVLAGVLLTLPLLSVDASASAAIGEAAKLEQPLKLTATCYMYWMGQWWPYTC